MTNGEKLKEVFPNGAYVGSGTWISMEYKEPATKNDLAGDCVSRKFMYELGATCIATRNEAGKLIALGAIEELPPVTPQQMIPVKVRLPKKSEYGDVLVTFVPPAGELWATVIKAHYSDLMGIAKPCFHIGEVGKESFENITPQVTAWMPLPQPYKAESENT